MKTTCTDCIYKGVSMDYFGPVITEWISCTCPIPWYLKSKAVPYRDIFGNIIEHNCDTFKKIETSSVNIDEEEVYGC